MCNVGLPEGFRFYDLRHTGYPLVPQGGRHVEGRHGPRRPVLGEGEGMIHQHSTLERQKEVAAARDARVRAERLDRPERGRGKWCGSGVPGLTLDRPIALGLT